jgi:hypothetical protein
MHGADPRTAKWRDLEPDARMICENGELRDLFIVEIEA